jgi:hypothetical protein
MGRYKSTFREKGDNVMIRSCVDIEMGLHVAGALALEMAGRRGKVLIYILIWNNTLFESYT